MGDLIIETRGLTKSFGGFVALDGLELTVKRGDIHGLIGPNGAGKSTTMRILVGATRPSSGTAFVSGFVAGSKDASRLIGYSPERPAVIGDMTARDYLVYMARLSGLRLAAADDAARDVLAWQGLTEFADVRVKGFSAGMKQRLSVAQSVVHGPELLILDEPTANLDAGGRIDLLERLKGLSQDRGTTILISSHVLSELEYLINTASFIDKGSLIVSGPLEQLKSSSSLQPCYLLSTSDNQSVLQVLQGNATVHKAWLGEDGLIHIVARDSAALENIVTGLVAKCGGRLKRFEEERITLQDLYESLVERDENCKNQ